MITYRTATSLDNPQLLELTRSAGMPGTIGLRTERDPDFFGMMRLRGPSTVLVAVAGERVVGSICLSKEDAYESGAKCELYYISDFKVHPRYRNQGIGLQLTHEGVDYLMENQADLALLHVAKGNARPFAFFSERTPTPIYENIGAFRVIQFLGKKKLRASDSAICELDAGPEVLQFLNDYYKERQLARVVTGSDLENVLIYGYFKGGEIRALLCLQDTGAFKQHVITRLPALLRGIVSLNNAVCRLLGTTRLPRVSEPIRMLYIKYLAAPDGNRKVVRCLIRKARQVAFDGSYAFVSLGLHERDPLLALLPGTHRLVFKSTGILVSMKRSRETVARVHAGIPFKDFSTV